MKNASSKEPFKISELEKRGEITGDINIQDLS
jgi:hypothetical protein